MITIGQFADRAALASYAEAEGLVMGQFHCECCHFELDWICLPEHAANPETTCPECDGRGTIEQKEKDDNDAG